MTWSLVVDLLLVLLLGAVLVYAILLNRKLAELRDNKSELARLIANFNDATVRAESSIPRLRKAADDAKTNLQEKLDKAQTLKDDLAFMIDRGESMANRLESSVRMARGESMPAVAPRAAEPRAEARAEARAESRYVETPVRAPEPRAPEPRAAETRAAEPGRGEARLREAKPAEARNGAARPGRAAEPRLDEFRRLEADLDERSEAERALLKALQSVR